MKTEQKVSVIKVGEEITFKTVITRTVSMSEAHKELLAIRSQVKSNLSEMDKINEQKKLIEEGILDKQLKSIADAEVKNAELIAKLETLLLPELNALRTKLKRKIKESKIKKGYDRIKDTSQKIVVQNQIIGPIANDLDLEMDDPLIKEMKVGFDKI